MMPSQHGLFDIGTNILLAVHSFAPIVVFLAEAIPNSYYDFSLNTSKANKLDVATIDSANYTQWTWSKGVDRLFVPTPASVLTPEIKLRSQLAVAKAEIISRIMSSIGYMRAPVGTGVLFQEAVYTNKRREAERIKESGYVTDAPHRYPYVVQYADLAGVSIKEAVDEILFQAELDDQLLAKTETLRIRYFNRVKKASTPEEVHVLFLDYRRDSYFNGMV